jgi:hypothetical protein
LKEAQSELVQARAAAVKASRIEAPSKNSRKRAALEISADVNIGTPDGVADRRKRPAKRGRMDQTMVGEKSMFSITPFLNRTISVAPDTPGDDSEAECSAREDLGNAQVSTEQSKMMEPETQPEVVVTTPSAAPKSRGRKKATEKPVPKEKKILGEAKPSIKNKKVAPKKSRTINTLDMVTEEGDENEEPEILPEKAQIPSKLVTKAVPVQTKGAEEEPKKMKRKILGVGKTLFDEDDGEATKRPVKVTLGAPRLLGKGGLAGPKGGMKGGIAASNGFGGFSPLKKDRRGVGASFLG